MHCQVSTVQLVAPVQSQTLRAAESALACCPCCFWFGSPELAEFWVGTIAASSLAFFGYPGSADARNLVGSHPDTDGLPRLVLYICVLLAY